MDSKEIREAIDDLDWAVKCLDTRGQRGEMMDKCFEHIKSLKAALSTIESDAIRLEELLRDALDRMYTMVSEPDFPIMPDKYYHHVLNAKAILGAEPAQDDGRAAIGDVVAWRLEPLADGYMVDTWSEIYRCGDRKPIILMRAGEVKRRLEETEE